MRLRFTVLGAGMTALALPLAAQVEVATDFATEVAEKAPAQAMQPRLPGVPRRADSFQPTNAKEQPAEALIDRYLRIGARREAFVYEAPLWFRSYDTNGDGLDGADLDLVILREGAQARGQAASEIVRHDLNGDQRVTKDEHARASRGDQDGESTEWQRQMIERYDSNMDGVVTLTEGLAIQTDTRRLGEVYQMRRLLAADPNADGRITTAELVGFAEAVFDSADADQDKQISDEEMRAYRGQVESADARLLRLAATSGPGCDALVPDKASKIIAFGIYDSKAASSSFVGGPGIKTTTARVTIEPGKEPLFLILTSYDSVVWRFEGDVKRVAGVIVSSYKSVGGGVSASGVAGVPAAKVSVTSRHCMPYFTQVKSDEAMQMAANVRALSGRSPAEIFASHDVVSVSFPSGMVTTADGRNQAPVQDGFLKRYWDEAMRYWPGGLVQIAPGSIVAAKNVAVGRYAVLPSTLGIAQLISNNSLLPLPDSAGFKLVKPIPYWPAEMNGGHSTRFVIGAGVPMPSGSPGHSKVIREDGPS